MMFLYVIIRDSKTIPLKTSTWNSYCLACCTVNFFRTNRCASVTCLRKFITHTSCFFKLLNNPVDSDSRWCNNTNRKLSTTLSFSLALPTAINKCPKGVEQSGYFIQLSSYRNFKMLDDKKDTLYASIYSSKNPMKHRLKDSNFKWTSIWLPPHQM
jgi:hypothetical protein